MEVLGTFTTDYMVFQQNKKINIIIYKKIRKIK